MKNSIPVRREACEVFKTSQVCEGGILKKIIWQSLIVILMLMTIWVFKSLPGWLIEQEMKKQVANLGPVPPSPISHVKPPEPSGEVAEQ